MIMRYYLHVWDRYYNNESTFVIKANTANEAQTIAEEEGELLAADHWDDEEADYEEDADEAELYDRYINDAVCYEIYQIKTNIAETADELDSIARDEDPKFFIEKYCNPQPIAKDI